MKIDLTIQNGKQIYYPIAGEGITLEWERKGAPGKLKFSCIKDKTLSFQEGNIVRLAVDGKPVFKGYVFTKSRSGKSPYLIEVTAYDQLRYFKNKYTYAYENKKANEVVKDIAGQFQLETGMLDDSGYVIPHRSESDASLFDIVQNALDETTKMTGKMYVLYDDAGKLTLKNSENMKLDVLIDGDTASDYTYSSTIDNKTYNRIVITSKSENTDSGQNIYTVSDDAKIKEWGVLQYTDSVSQPQNMKYKAETMLRNYSSKTRSLSISDAFGDIRVRGGSYVAAKFELGDMNIQNYLLVEHVTHKFKQNQHLMDLKLRGGTFVN